MKRIFTLLMILFCVGHSNAQELVINCYFQQEITCTECTVPVVELFTGIEIVRLSDGEVLRRYPHPFSVSYYSTSVKFTNEYWSFSRFGYTMSSEVSAAISCLTSGPGDTNTFAHTPVIDGAGTGTFTLADGTVITFCEECLTETETTITGAGTVFDPYVYTSESGATTEFVTAISEDNTWYRSVWINDTIHSVINELGAEVSRDTIPTDTHNVLVQDSIFVLQDANANEISRDTIRVTELWTQSVGNPWIFRNSPVSITNDNFFSILSDFTLEDVDGDGNTLITMLNTSTINHSALNVSSQGTSTLSLKSFGNTSGGSIMGFIDSGTTNIHGGNVMSITADNTMRFGTSSSPAFVIASGNIFHDADGDTATPGQILGNNSGLLDWITLVHTLPDGGYGDIDISGSGAVMTINDNTIDSSNIVDYSIISVDIDTGAVTTLQILDGTILSEDLMTEIILEEHIAEDAINGDQIQDGTISAVDLGVSSVTTFQILNETILGEDIAEETIVNDNIQDGAISEGKLGNNAVTATKVAVGAITTTGILDKTIAAIDIDTGAVTTLQILDGTITASDIALGNISGAHIGEETITGDNIVNGAIGNSQMADNSVTTNKIVNETILSEDIADETITTVDITEDAITTDLVLDGTLTAADLAATGPTTGAYLYPSSVSVNAQGQVTGIVDGSAHVLNHRVVIKSASDFGVISDTVEYFLDGIIDMGSTSIEIPAGGIYITGYNFDLSGLISTANGYTLFTSPVGGSGNVLFDNFHVDISGTASQVYALVSDTGNEAIEVDRINYNNCSSLGEIDNYRQGLETGTGRFGGTPNLILSGAWSGGYFINTSIVRGLIDGSYALYEEGTAFVMQSRFRSNQNVDLNTTVAFADFVPANFANPNTFQLSECIITRNGVSDASDATIIPNISSSDIASMWRTNNGITNTFVGGETNITAEATTTISVANTFVDIAGTYTASALSHFDSPASGQLRHLADNPQEYKVFITGSLVSTASDEVSIKVVVWDDSASGFVDYKTRTKVVNNLSGGRNVAFFAFTDNIILDTNDYVKFQCANVAATNNITAELDTEFSVEER